MFNLDFLRVIREFEYLQVLGRLRDRSHVLEIGGGTGYQAKRLTEDGHKVESIDVPGSNYSDQKEFPVQSYDGRSIPFPDAIFDVVYSSNVLEHVRDLPYLQKEIKRVLKPGGYCIHLMPTGAWRFWTSVAHYLEFVQRAWALAPRLMPRGLSTQAQRDALAVLRLLGGIVRTYAIVPRHGETGNAISEIWTFSAWHWRRCFRRSGFKVAEASPTGLFYTGHMIFGAKIPVARRQALSRFLGSACVIYVVMPK